MPRMISLCMFLLLLLLAAGNVSFAQKDKIEGIWYNQEKTAKVQLYKAVNGKFYGKIVWLKESGRNGQPRVDENNPDKAKRNTPLLNLLVLKGFKKSGDNVYDGGTIYDPKNGKTYDCKITYKGKTLDIRGYVAITLIGRTAVWERAE